MTAARLCCVISLAAMPAGLAGQIPIRVGQTITGRLVLSDQQFRDGSRYKTYVFVGNKGDTVTAALASDDLDANLILTDAHGNPLARNDDGGGSCNARIDYVLPAAGSYRLYANSSAPVELGEFHLSLATGRAPEPSDTTCRGFGQVAGLVRVGQTVNGMLSADDPLLASDSSRYQRWILPLEAKQTVTVDLASDDFDAYLILTRGRGQKLAENDNGTGGCDARLVWTAKDDHPVRIVVNSAGRLQAGKFTLRVSDGASPVELKGSCRFHAAGRDTAAGSSGPGPQPVGRTIAVGQSVLGQLSRDDHYRRVDSTYSQPWQLVGTAGQTVTIDLESDEFDPYLFVAGPGIDPPLQDDDGAGNCNARLTVTFLQSGTFLILVNSAEHEATGAFSLSVTAGAKPKSLARCRRDE